MCDEERYFLHAHALISLQLNIAYFFKIEVQTTFRTQLFKSSFISQSSIKCKTIDRYIDLQAQESTLLSSRSPEKQFGRDKRNFQTGLSSSLASKSSPYKRPFSFLRSWTQPTYQLKTQRKKWDFTPLIPSKHYYIQKEESQLRA